MSRMRAAFALFVALVLALGASQALASNQSSDDGDTEATIEALQTTVAEQATTIAELSPSPTPTPEQKKELPIPASEPIDLGLGVFLYSYLLIDTDDGLYLAADLVNSSGSPMVVPSVTATYFDSDGAELGSDNLFHILTWADKDSHMPYSTSTVLDDAYELSEIDRVEFSIEPNSYYAIEEVDASNLEIVGVPLEGPEGSISGRLKNNGTTPVSEISVVYALYDAEGIIVGSCYTYLDVTIPPGKSAKFTISGSCGSIYSAEDHSAGGKPFSYRLMISL